MQMEKVAERFYYERPSAARKAEIIEYLNEFAAAGSEIKVSGSLDRILSGWTFEQALEELRGYSEKMQRKDLSLEEAIECYEKGMECFEKCRGELLRILLWCSGVAQWTGLHQPPLRLQCYPPPLYRRA